MKKGALRMPGIVDIRAYAAIGFVALAMLAQGCATTKDGAEPEAEVEYFHTTMNLYGENRQPTIGMVEINERAAFEEMVREILDDPDYEFSTFQNDLYYVAQIYNNFSVDLFTKLDGSTFEAVSSTGTQATYLNPATGERLEIRTQLVQGRYSEVVQYLLDAGYSIHTTTFGNTQTILTIDYRGSVNTSRSEPELQNPSTAIIPEQPADVIPNSPPSITIVNNTGFTVYHVYVSPVTSDEWGADRLADDQVLSNEQSVSLQLPYRINDVNQYDIRLVDLDGDSYKKRNVTVSNSSRITFTFDDFDSANLSDTQDSAVTQSAPEPAAPTPRFSSSRQASNNEFGVGLGMSVVGESQGYSLEFLGGFTAITLDWIPFTWEEKDDNGVSQYGQTNGVLGSIYFGIPVGYGFGFYAGGGLGYKFGDIPQGNNRFAWKLDAGATLWLFDLFYVKAGGVYDNVRNGFGFSLGIGVNADILD